MGHQDSNSSDFSAKFSTLNMNAMEFVPSFAYSGATTATVAANNDEPADSWDTEKEPNDEEEAELEEGEGEVVQKTSKKKRPEVDDDDEVKKGHVSDVFIGHGDAGKSTIGGQIMTLTGMIDKRTTRST
ncbi:unnamed protein product [Hermetia illucens]|uniref:Tr-type G domain-containing protein n=1 Tax=Hermetia illucens TaxID=343691 RepID=A0A7R8YZF7_HERIL|nr:unnamed protein product [Hermetia illucens]